MWEYEFFPFEMLLAALTDRDDSNIAISLIEQLLLSKMEFADRMRYFISLKIDPQHWKEPDFFSKHHQYHAKYPENWGVAYISKTNQTVVFVAPSLLPPVLYWLHPSFYNNNHITLGHNHHILGMCVSVSFRYLMSFAEG